MRNKGKRRRGEREEKKRGEEEEKRKRDGLGGRETG